MILISKGKYMKIEFKWQRIHKGGTKEMQDITLRAKVIGGWIVKSICVRQLKYNEKRTETLIFLQDEKHEWEV
jgi:hypothetical protein